MAYKDQGRNHVKMLDANSKMVGKICPPPLCLDRVKVSENFGPVTPAVTSLQFKQKPKQNLIEEK